MKLCRTAKCLPKAAIRHFTRHPEQQRRFRFRSFRRQLHGEAYVNYYVELAQDAFYAPAGTELYRRQIPVTSGVYLADEKMIVGETTDRIGG